jgi:hypothetical protein
MFTFRNVPCTQETLIKTINTYKRCGHLNMTFYNKALSYINKGFQPVFTVKDGNNSYKLFKVVKVTKGSKI